MSKQSFSRRAQRANSDVARHSDVESGLSVSKRAASKQTRHRNVELPVEIQPLEGRMMLSGGASAISALAEQPVAAIPMFHRAAVVQVPTQVTVLQNLTTSVFGQKTTFTATVRRTSGRGIPTGTVTFKSKGVSIGAVATDANGVATLTFTTQLVIGADAITAVYGGATAYAPSTSAAITHTVTKANTATTLSASSSSATFGGVVTLTATLLPVNPGRGYPTGTVTFKSNGTTIGTGTLNATGVATFAAGTQLTVGTDQLTAVYGGSANYNASSSAQVAHSVAQAATTTTLTSSAATTFFGSPVKFTAQLLPVAPGRGYPTGSVQFYDGATLLGTATLNATGQAGWTKTDFYKGAHSITAKYVGVSGYAASQSAVLTQTFNMPTTTDVYSPNNLQAATLVSGSGAGAVAGQGLTVNYTGYLTDGTKFDSSLNPGHTPFDFLLGNGNVIVGWDKGLLGAKVGEQRLLIVPPALGYGAGGQGNIPGNATLYFIVKILAFDKPTIVIHGGTNQAVQMTSGQAASSTNLTAFGSIAMNASSAVSTFSINAGNAAGLGFTTNPAIVLAGTNAADFTLTQPVIANGTATFTVKFNPKSKGAKSATVTINSTDPVTPGFVINVTGTGV